MGRGAGVQSLVPARGPDPLPVRQQYSQLTTTGLETGVVNCEKRPKGEATTGFACVNKTPSQRKMASSL